MNTEIMQRVQERLGEAVYSEADVINEFSGKSVEDILEVLNALYPFDDNDKFATEIYELIN